MEKLRKNIYKALILLAFLALPGSDVECEDDEFEFDWPEFSHEDHDDGYYVEPAPCCWYW